MLEVCDNFLENYSQLKKYSLECDFKAEKNMVDDTVYPHICKNIPAVISSEILSKLAQFKGSPIKSPFMFLRMTTADTKPPHYAHTDKIMGDFSFMLYLTEGEGTFLLRHLMTGIAYHPLLQSFEKIIADDQNNKEAWIPYLSVSAEENRAAIFDARAVHAAGAGFGDSQNNARIVLTCFFS